MEHSIDTPKAETLEELGTKIGQLRTDALVVVLRSMYRELFLQKQKNITEKKFERVKYDALVIEYLGHVITFLISTFKLSKSLRPDNFKERPPLIHTD